MAASPTGQRCTTKSSSPFPAQPPPKPPDTSTNKPPSAYRHLKPGYGHLEQVEIDLRPRCDDSTHPGKQSPLFRWYDYIEDATTRGSKSIAYLPNTVDMLRNQGFVDIQETVIRLPLNSWPQDPHQKAIGRWYNLGMCEGLEAMSLGPLTRVFQWSPQDVRRLVGEVKTAVCNRNYHVYNNL